MWQWWVARGQLWCQFGFLFLPLTGLQGLNSACQDCMASPFTCWAIASAPGTEFYNFICSIYFICSHKLFLVGNSVPGHNTGVTRKTEDPTHALQPVLPILADKQVECACFRSQLRPAGRMVVWCLQGENQECCSWVQEPSRRSCNLTTTVFLGKTPFVPLPIWFASV